MDHTPHRTDDQHSARGVRTRAGLLAAGWTDGQIASAVRDGRLMRALAGTYVDGPGELSAFDRLRALVVHYGADTTAVLGTAASIHGLPAPWPHDDLVHVALPPGREQLQRAGARIHTWLLAESECVVVDGLRATTPLRTVVDLMCTADKLSAVAALDTAMRTGLLGEEQVRAMPSLVRRRRGAARSRSWWRLGDPRAESPLESRVRVRAVDGGYPPDSLQHRLTAGGRQFRVDLAWFRPGRRALLMEADGDAFHSSSLAIANDRARANAIVSEGEADLIRVVWRDTLHADTVPTLLEHHLGPPRSPRRPQPR